MKKTTFSLCIAWIATLAFIGLPNPSYAAGSGRVYFSGNIKMPDGKRLRVYVSGVIKSTGQAIGNIALIGPAGRLMCYMKTGEIASDKAATLYGTLEFKMVDGGVTVPVPARVQIDLTKNGAEKSLGWRVVSTDETEGSPFPAGTILWESGSGADGSILQKPLVGIAILLYYP